MFLLESSVPGVFAHDCASCQLKGGLWSCLQRHCLAERRQNAKQSRTSPLDSHDSTSILTVHMPFWRGQRTSLRHSLISFLGNILQTPLRARLEWPLEALPNLAYEDYIRSTHSGRTRS